MASNGTGGTADIVWGYWLSSGTATVTSATMNTEYSFITTVWQYWTDGATADFSTVDGTNMVWVNWADYASQIQQRRELTAQEQAAVRACEEKRKREEAEAAVRAEKLLTENLTEEQLSAYREKKIIPIATARGRYHIYRGRAGNVYRVDENGKQLERYCIHPTEFIPTEDVMLAQLLWLRWCEDDFLKVANKTRLAA